MFRDPSVAGDWATLVRRLDGAGTLGRWSSAESALAGVTSAADLPRRLAPARSPAEKDAVLGALVRLAAADGGDETDAVLLVLHLLSEGATALASRIRDLTDEPMAMAIGQLAVQIRSFPWRRRSRAIAANLLLDTRAALLKELLPNPRDGRLIVELVDPADRRLSEFSSPESDDELRLADMVAWASAQGVITLEDGELLIALAGRADGMLARDVAERRAVGARTLRRRRARTIAALRGVRFQYLEAAA